MRDIAVEAGVSMESVYGYFRTKEGLLKELLGVTVGGDDAPVPVPDRAPIKELRAEPDGRGKLVRGAADADEKQVTDAVARTVAELGRLDTLINNAGVMLLGPAAGAPLPECQQMIELNVLGLLYCAHAALPHLLRAAEDSPRHVAGMVNISSVAGRVARNGNGVYSLTKHGTRLPGRAGRDRDGASRAQPARGARQRTKPVRAADAGRRHRRRDHLHPYPAAARRGE